MDHETNGAYVSPLPPPPPPSQHRPISIRDILDDYYEGESFSSGMNNADALNIADSVMAEIDQISPPKEHVEDTAGSHCIAVHNDVSEIVRSAGKMKVGNVPSKPEKGDNGNSHRTVNASPSKASKIQSNPDQPIIAPQPAKCRNLDQQSRKLHINDEKDYKKRSEVAHVAIDHHAAGTKSAQKQDVKETVPKSPPIFNESKNIKKRFLRKGARKEPSALHRSNQIGDDNKKESKSLSGESDRAKKLEELERMQEKQVEDLNKRIHRRQQAREEIHSRGCKVQVMDHEGDKKCDKSLEEAQECHQSLQASSQSSESDDGSMSSNSSEKSDNISDNFSFHSKDEKMEVSKPEPRRRKRQLKLPQKRQTIHKKATMCSPLKLMNKVKNKNRLSSTKDLRTPEMEEQWQLMKSMRRRQEAALQTAEKEREETNAWAASEKDKVNKWKDNQRSLILKEKQRTMNSAMVSQRKKRHELLEEQAAEAVQFSQKRARAEIDSLKESLNKQRIEADATKSRHRLNEKRWKDMISERDKRIQELLEEMKCIKEKNEKVKHEKCELNIKVEEMMKEKKKRKKKSKTSSKKSEVQIVGEEISQDCESERNEITNKHDFEHMIHDHGATEKALPHADQISSHDKESKDVEELDNDVVQIISSNQDLIEQPTEAWLQPRLRSVNVDDAQNEENEELKRTHQRIDFTNTATSKDVYYTPLKERPYDPLKYTNMEESKDTILTQANVPSTGKMNKAHEHRHANGTRVVTYQNGTVKENHLDGTTLVRFANGDIKTSYGNVGITVYYHSESKVG